MSGHAPRERARPTTPLPDPVADLGAGPGAALTTHPVTLLVDQARRAARLAEETGDGEAYAELMRRAGADGDTALRLGRRLLSAADPGERALGCDLLRDACDQNEHVRARATEALVTLAGRETDAGTLSSLARALECTHDPRAVPVLVALAAHPDPEVRCHVAASFAGVSAPHAAGPGTGALIGLTRDPDPRVRDGATFTLGFQAETDGAAIREALWERVRDTDADVAEEAVRGLARRHAPGILPHLLRLLASPDGAHTLTFHAAAILGAPELMPALAGFDLADPGVADATEACDPAVRGELDDFAAQLVKALHRVRPDLDASVAMPRFAPGLLLELPGARPTAGHDVAGYDVAGLLHRAGGDPARAAALVSDDLPARGERAHPV
ncbi:HEAT repeat domain-containing protein [Streptomyces sp. NBC_01218]|uniref:HEAT repeat domain-containing protein n=1 Tax=Streptomyces sp. NBC_01218 TaxID=2903780 RepID=UPI002E147624|nr:HEAT repeat domain-containing protein [Streptomyces sp. NBC_01218]